MKNQTEYITISKAIQVLSERGFTYVTSFDLNLMGYRSRIPETELERLIEQGAFELVSYHEVLHNHFKGDNPALANAMQKQKLGRIIFEGLASKLTYRIYFLPSERNGYFLRYFVEKL
ncbi:hypothetical protein DRZ77_00105 [Candidatus Woesearchaeota archaeon]|nr:hypothetical protein [Candidatus Woesearchaeota archaeon]RLE41138.1 MAG: hypothetical protein DRZ77_00105 [Candidatus Woesearchaeota archaeon]